MTVIMTMIMIIVMSMIMIMTLTMVSYHHHEAPGAVRGSVGGCSMDIWCPDGIGREIWYREGREGIGITSTPARGSTPARDISPSTGGSVSILSSALPYPSFPALCRKDTTYPWSNRLRSHYNIVMMMVMMMMMMVMIMVMVMMMVLVMVPMMEMMVMMTMMLMMVMMMMLMMMMKIYQRGFLSQVCERNLL